MGLLCAAAELYSLVIIARSIISFFPVSPGSPIAPVVEILHRVTEPVFAPIRRFIPPVSGFDLSPLVALIAIQVVSMSLFGC